MLTDFTTSPTSLETQTSMEETSSLNDTSHHSRSPKPIGLTISQPTNIVSRKDSNNNQPPSLARSLSNSMSTSPSFLNSPKEALQRFFFGYHSKTKRSLTEEAECGDEFSVQSWTKDGVDPNQVDEYGYTPLLNAAVLGRLNACVELVKVGADVNKKGSFGFTPLHAAAQNGRREVVSYLIEQNADVNAQNEDQDTPMHLALRTNRNEIVNLLLRSGANPRLNGFKGKCCIEIARDTGLSDLALTFESSPNGTDAGDVFAQSEP